MLLRMTNTNDHEGGAAPREGIEHVQRIGAWKVTMWLPLDSASGNPREIRIEPHEEADPQEVARGITTTVLRQIDTTSPGQEMVRARGESALADVHVGLTAMLPHLPRGVSDEYLAVLSAFYVRVVEIGERAPVQELEAITGTKQATLKGHLRAARQRGFLTKVEGKAGGQLTDKAIETLKGINVEEVLRQP